MLQYINIPENDFGNGIDQQSAENLIPPGYVEDATNADFTPTGYIKKRAGYVRFAGNLPARIASVQYTSASTDNICFYLDSAISLPSHKNTPVIVTGKTSSSNFNNVGDFPSDLLTTKYYSEFTSDIRKVFLTGTNTLTIAQSEHGFSTADLFIGLGKSNSQVNNSNEYFKINKISINTSTYDISLEYVNLTGSNFDGFVWVSNKSAAAGTSYVQAGNTVNTGSSTFTILESTHNLNNNNIIVKTYLDTGTALELIEPDTVILNDSTGDVQISFVNDSGSSFTAVFILVSADDANILNGSVASGATQTAVISGVSSPFAFISCYLEPTIGSSIREEIEPDSIEVDEAAGTISITFVNSYSSSANFEIYYDFSSIQTNKLCVTGSVISSGDVFTDLAPQLTLYGLDHSDIYASYLQREGWATHIDTYRSSSENKLISGLGGNLFSAESTFSLQPTLYPRIFSRVASDSSVGPAFYFTGETPSRTRGYITGTTLGTNQYLIQKVLYNSGTTWTDYYLNIPNLSINGTLSTIISAVSGMEDQLTAEQCGYGLHNGTFTIKSVSNPDSTTLVISVSNPDNTADYDEQDAGGLGGIFTDKFTTTASDIFLPGDILASALFVNGIEYTVVNSSGTTVLISGVTEPLDIPGGLRIAGTRSSYVIPLKNNLLSADVTNLVQGDVLAYNQISRPITIVSINQLSDISISIDGDGTTAVATLGSGTTSSIYVGKKLLIAGSASYNGVVTVTDLSGDGVSFSFDSTAITTESGTLVGKTIEVDEQLTFADTVNSTNYFTVPYRWIPIESPTDAQDTTPKTVYRYFDSSSYANQNIIRSTMVQDSLYLTSNGADETLKYDGQSIYRAGFARWQSQLFATPDTSTAVVNANNPNLTYDSVSGSSFVATANPNGAKQFQIGDLIQDSQDGSYYTITDIKIDTDSTGAAVTGTVYVNKTISGSSGTKLITKISTFKYYARLNMVDANNNIIASAATGENDYIIRMGANAGVRFKLLGMPAWDLYDYDRIEMELYRTKANSSGPFYKLVTLPVSFDNNDGYLNYIDSDSDDTLDDLDSINTALKGAELGTAWDQPLRAKHITSAGNRLILGNLKGYPTLDIQLLKIAGTLVQSDFTASANKLWLFRKDNTDTGTSTNMSSRVNYEFTSNALTVTGITGYDSATVSSIDTGTNIITTSASHFLNEQTTVTFTSSGTLPGGISAGINYYTTALSGTTLLISLTPSGPAVDITSAGSGTITIHYNEPRFNVTFSAAHGMSAGSWVYLFYPSISSVNNDLTYSGWWQVRNLNGPNAVIINSHSIVAGAASYFPTRGAYATTRADVPVFIGTDGNYNVYNGNPSSSEPYLFTAIRRLGNAINGSMRQADIYLTPAFKPWMIANSGNEFQAGQLVVRAPKIFDTELELVLPSLNGVYNVYVNNIKRVGGEQISASANLYPSRILISYPNFPEIFDKPEAVLDSDSDSVIDINSADGQEITAIIPFFGSSAFGAALQSGVVVVFKSNSIYLVDLAAKAAGTNPVQQLETRGKGCTAPYSVALTKNGIIFANESGIYRLNRSMAVEYVGQKYERKFNNNINLDMLSLATGHHDAINNVYKLSYPVSTDIRNSLVAVYNHTREDYNNGVGSWTTYDNHPSVGWANLQNSRFFASTLGKVFQVRDALDKTDFRDDNVGINFSVLTRALDQGDGGARKNYRHFVTHFRAGDNLTTGTSINALLDLKSTLKPTNSFRINPNLNEDNLSDTGNQKVVSIQSNIQEKKGIYIQISFTNSTIDEAVEITGINLTVADKGFKGITKAART